jgi:hypothetical protein
MFPQNDGQPTTEGSLSMSDHDREVEHTRHKGHFFEHETGDATQKGGHLVGEFCSHV